MWPKKDYLSEAYKQLDNTECYLKITNDPTLQILLQIKTFVNRMHDDTTYKFLYPEITTRTQTLYLLPKVHKPDIPGRPIISGCGGPTVKLSQCPDHILTRIFSLNSNLPNNIILVTIEVKSLYTNIPNDEGIRACIDMLK